jgi:dolichol-phosphate mannosyltransferase
MSAMEIAREFEAGSAVICDAGHRDGLPLADSTVSGLARLTVVTPLFNEAESIERLATALGRLKHALAEKYVVELLFIDDGSRDATCEIWERFFAGDENARLVRHEVNRGIAAAIATGIAEAQSEIVASIDADCTYEPLQLVELLTRFRDDVHLVVASPYHPDGQVVGVPRWRLAISRLASRMYGLLLRNQLHTYTSCFRVYRRSAVVGLPVRRGGFVGVVELLWQVDRHGGTVVECPAVLSVRTTGQSKMRVARTTLAHLGLLAEAAWRRIWNGSIVRKRSGGRSPSYRHCLGKT